MRAKAAAALLLVATLAAATPAAQGFFHFAGWSAAGVAQGEGAAYVIDIRWTGTIGNPYAAYHVTLKDATLAVVSAADFFGYEAVELERGTEQVEVLGGRGGSLDPAVEFTFTAAWVGTAAPRLFHAGLVGEYAGLTFVAVASAQRF